MSINYRSLRESALLAGYLISAMIGASMQPEQTFPIETSPGAIPLAAQVSDSSAWSTDFVVGQPEPMPSERMQARAELVRMACNCDSY